MLVPWLDVDATFAEMDAWTRQVESLLGRRGLDGRHGLRTFDGRAPTLVEGKDGVARWSADLPGVRKEDLSILLEGGTLTLEVKREATTPEGWQLRHAERSPFELIHTFRLPEDVDPDGIDAAFEHGVLTVSLPRKARASRTIEIRHP